MKRIVSVLLAVCLLLSLGGCTFMQDIKDLAENEEAQPKTFEFEGLSIELTTDFLRMDFVSKDYDFVVGNETVAVFGMKMLFEDTDLGDMTVLDFAQYFRTLMEDSNPTEVSEMEGIPTMQYGMAEDGEDQTAVVTFYKGSDCFWVLCFAVDTEDFQGAYEDICGYAKSVQCQ